MSAHTPGPWKASGNGVHAGMRCVALTHFEPWEQRAADARLIAAAPELLEAAIELKDVCNRPSAARTRAEAWRKLDKAIAKALQPNAEVSGLSTRPPGYRADVDGEKQ